ncbi:MAG: radical SAM protein, partial [Comamonas sp.]
MAVRVIPLVDQRTAALTAAVPQLPTSPSGHLLDQLGRPLRDLRISVTDRCNFRCQYCMPKEVFDKNYTYLPHSALLSFEEITRLARVFLAHGVHKIRLTGGEPLLRKNLEALVEQLAALRIGLDALDHHGHAEGFAKRQGAADCCPATGFTLKVTNEI